MKVIVDTNIIFSAILSSQGGIGQIITCSSKNIKFYSPQFLQFEINNHLQKIKAITKLSDSELFEVIEIIYSKILFISEEFIPKESLIIADNLTRDIDYDDVLFVALTIHLNGKLWTGDKKLKDALMAKGFKKFISIAELKDKMKG